MPMHIDIKHRIQKILLNESVVNMKFVLAVHNLKYQNLQSVSAFWQHNII